jgi:hypothetical protein
VLYVDDTKVEVRFAVSWVNQYRRRSSLTGVVGETAETLPAASNAATESASW